MKYTKKILSAARVGVLAKSGGIINKQNKR